MEGRVWVEPVGNLIIARVRGEPSEALLRECQERVLQLVKDTRQGRVLYDALEMVSPTVDVAWSQRTLDAELDDVRLRRAIVVPNTRLAYLARLAFGEGDYRVFYNDMTAAVTWLAAEAP
jgi:ribosomal protein L1